MAEFSIITPISYYVLFDYIGIQQIDVEHTLIADINGLYTIPKNLYEQIIGTNCKKNQVSYNGIWIGTFKGDNFPTLDVAALNDSVQIRCMDDQLPDEGFRVKGRFLILADRQMMYTQVANGVKTIPAFLLREDHGSIGPEDYARDWTS